MKTELLTALQPAFYKIGSAGIRYSAIAGHTMELADALNEQLSAKWRDLRGIEIVSMGVSSITASEEDEKMLKSIIGTCELVGQDRDSSPAARHLVEIQTNWLKTLKERCTWKPSDEQMADLWNMLCECRPADHQLLQDIYYGLKKLR